MPSAAERARRRAAVFGDDPVAGGDERDDTDRARERHGNDRDRYDAERPPHHDRP